MFERSAAVSVCNDSHVLRMVVFAVEWDMCGTALFRCTACGNDHMGMGNHSLGNEHISSL
jgi:hypothetical protein